MTEKERQDVLLSLHALEMHVNDLSRAVQWIQAELLTLRRMVETKEKGQTK